MYALLQYPERAASAAGSCRHSDPYSLTQAPALQRVRTCRSCAHRGAAPSCAATTASTGDLPTRAWSLQPGHRNSRALAASWLMLTTPTALSSTPAGYRSSTLLYFTAATGRATSSRRDAAWWMTSNGIGARRPPSPLFPKLHMLHSTVEFAERHCCDSNATVHARVWLRLRR